MSTVLVKLIAIMRIYEYILMCLSEVTDVLVEEKSPGTPSRTSCRFVLAGSNRKFGRSLLIKSHFGPENIKIRIYLLTFCMPGN